jgi:SAM-dependent methyltransferase
MPRSGRIGAPGTEVGMSAWADVKGWWKALEDEQSSSLEQLPTKWARWAVLAASAAALYLEMVVVRWHATCFHAFAIFKNVSLLSCFLGLGIGFALSGRRKVSLAPFFPLLALQTVLFGALSCTNLGGRIVNPVAEQLVMGRAGDRWSLIHAVEGNVFLLVVFLINAWMFIPVGHLAGRVMAGLPRAHAYSLNLLGSMVGIGLFFVLSLLWAGPEIWMGVAILGLVPFLAGGRRSVVLAAGCTAVILVGLGIITMAKGLTYYSPYQVITYHLPDPAVGRNNPTIRVNHCYYQEIFDCAPGSARAEARAVNYYGLPYRLQPEPGDVLVVGAGTGNDVAAALRHGAKSVTAVELDPAILMLGKRAHPEHPYQDPRTRTVVNDARTYIRHTDERFDTIVYGLLDSHTNLGAMTNVRVDSFVYTIEGLREAVGRLRGDGLVVVSYCLLDANQGRKLYGMLREAYPEAPPRAFCVPGSQHDAGTTFVTGPGLKRLPSHVPGARELTADFSGGLDRSELATDDWPFFYMKKRTYPFSYLVVIGLLLLVSGWLVRRNLRGAPRPTASWGLFFFLGAGFMLIETRGVTELGLTFGNTWWVVGVVISAILLMGYLANQWVIRRGPLPTRKAFVCLFAALLIGWAVGYLALRGVTIPAARLVQPVVLTLPLFFAGLIFSSELVRASDIGSALSANILGAMLGGLLEYNSMYWGYTSLYPLGLALYGLAFVCCLRGSRKAAQAEGAPEGLARAA